jgi:glucans biosynthesis protein
MIEAKARELAENEYHVSDSMAMPAWMKDLTYDQYRDIRFRVEKSLWASDDLPFRAQFFHPGYLFRDSVVINEFTDTHQQEVRFSQDLFTYGKLVSDHAEENGNVGYAGFKLFTDFHGNQGRVRGGIFMPVAALAA